MEDCARQGAFLAAGVVSWEFAFFLLLRAELLSAMFYPITTNGCPFHRGPGMLSLLKRAQSPLPGWEAVLRGLWGPWQNSAWTVAVTDSVPTLASLYGWY